MLWTWHSEYDPRWVKYLIRVKLIAPNIVAEYLLILTHYWQYQGWFKSNNFIIQWLYFKIWWIEWHENNTPMYIRKLYFTIQKSENILILFYKIVWLDPTLVNIIYSEFKNLSRKTKHHFGTSSMAFRMNI